MKFPVAKETIKKRGLFLLDKLLTFILTLSGIAFLWIVWQVFFWSSFVVPTSSMEPEIIPGDRVAVWKPWMGARIFNFFAALGGEQIPIRRLPGFRPAQRGDILVFNYPYSDGWDKITLDVKTYYVKRCIALPGDTLTIEEGFYKVSHIEGIWGNQSNQCALAHTSDSLLKKRHRWFTYPHDSLLSWNVKHFGPLYIPAQGHEITLDRKNYLLYRRLIEWETKETMRFQTEENISYQGKQRLRSYRFLYNYYFMAGDQVQDSEDSRYWGLVPEPFIVGRVGWVASSRDPDRQIFRWERWMRKVH